SRNAANTTYALINLVSDAGSRGSSAFSLAITCPLVVSSSTYARAETDGGGTGAAAGRAGAAAGGGAAATGIRIAKSASALAPAKRRNTMTTRPGRSPDYSRATRAARATRDRPG